MSLPAADYKLPKGYPPISLREILETLYVPDEPLETRAGRMVIDGAALNDDVLRDGYCK